MKFKTSVKAGIYTLGFILSIILFHSPIAPLTLAPLALGILVGIAASTAKEAFAAASLLGIASLFLTTGSTIGKSLSIIASVGGAPIVILVFVYYILTPALIASATRLLSS